MPKDDLRIHMCIAHERLTRFRVGITMGFVTVICTQDQKGTHAMKSNCFRVKLPEALGMLRGWVPSFATVTASGTAGSKLLFATGGGSTDSDDVPTVRVGRRRQVDSPGARGDATAQTPPCDGRKRGPNRLHHDLQAAVPAGAPVVVRHLRVQHPRFRFCGSVFY